VKTVAIGGLSTFTESVVTIKTIFISLFSVLVFEKLGQRKLAQSPEVTG
tara:strand:- start:853 stop:999 length:147 start_codon:yes stop_codon:yes gene_type:complete